MVHQKLIESLIGIIMTIGVFGNMNVIVAILRKKSLRNKKGMIILFLATSNLVCNISELFGLVMHFRFTPMSRRKCYQYNVLYTFFVLMQPSLFLIIAMDLYFSIVMPLKHMLWNKTRYLLSLLTFPILVSTFFIILSMYNLTDEIAPVCIFMLAPSPVVYQTLSSLNVICNIITLIIVITSICIASKKSKMSLSRQSSSAKMKDEKNLVFRSTFFMVVIYMGSWFLVTTIFKVIITFQDEKKAFEISSYMMVHQKLIESFIGIFMTIGVFGNMNVIVAVARKKVLRTKKGMIILFLAISNLFCNISELFGLVMHFRFTPMSRRKCYQYNIIYTFFVLIQPALFLITAMDLCFSIVMPLKHMLWNKTRYLLALSIFPVFFSIFCIFVSMHNLSDEIAPYCIFMLAPSPVVYQSLISLNVICNVTTLIIIISSICIASKKAKTMSLNRHLSSGSVKDERPQVFRSTFFMVVIYMGSWVFSSIIFKFMITWKEEQKAVEVLSYTILIVLPTYCQTYFVTYFRSIGFRRAYQEQLHWMSCGLLFPMIFEKMETRTLQAQSSIQLKQKNQA